jgi:hypothetical protein
MVDRLGVAYWLVPTRMMVGPGQKCKADTMTTLMAWVAYDQRRPSSFYIASDSRITWGSKLRRWDAGRKVFASTKFPDIFGYAGDVVFPALCLSQVVDAIDHGVLVSVEAGAIERSRAVYDAIRRSFDRRHEADNRDFTIFHAARSGVTKDAVFHLWSIEFIARTKSWEHVSIPVSKETSIVALAGSGGRIAKQNAERWIRELKPGVSRSIFSAFCDTIESQVDPLSGGAPQLAGLYLIGAARSFGIVHDGQPHLHGLPVVPSFSSTELEWRDRLLQRINGETLRLIPNAQRHARPAALIRS